MTSTDRLILIRHAPPQKVGSRTSGEAKTICQWILRKAITLSVTSAVWPPGPAAVRLRASQLSTCHDLGVIRDLARGFTDLLRTRGGAHLDAWVTQAEQGPVPQIRSFALVVIGGMRRRALVERWVLMAVSAAVAAMFLYWSVSSRLWFPGPAAGSGPAGAVAGTGGCLRF